MTYLVIPALVSIHDADVIAERQTLEDIHDFISDTALTGVQVCAADEHGRRRFLSGAELMQRNRMHMTRED